MVVKIKAPAKGHAFLTGSRVYGEPREDSDIDLVVQVTPKEYQKLLDQCSPPPGSNDPDYFRLGVFSLRFGKLNLICTTNHGEGPKHYEVWRKGTQLLKQKRKKAGFGVPREFACRLFDKLRAKAGLLESSKQTQAPTPPKVPAPQVEEEDLPF